MKKTLNINLGGLVFHIDEDAFEILDRYLATLRKQFERTQDGDEIIKDVEMRMAELFRARNSGSKEVINAQDLSEVIDILGQPEDYLDEETAQQQAQAKSEPAPPPGRGPRKIFRDPDDRILGGVAAGLAAYFNIDPLWLRLIFVALLFSGFGLPLYLVIWIVVPQAKTTAQKLQMRGEAVTLSNIERAIKEEASQVGAKFKSFGDKAKSYDYQRDIRRTGGFFGDLGRLIVDLARLLLKVIFKVLGFGFLVLGFIVLSSIVLALLFGDLNVDGNGVSIYNGLDFLQLIMASDTHYNAAVVGLTLLATAPLFILIYYGIRLLFRVEPLNRSVRNGLALLAFVGFLLSAGSAIRLAVEFRTKSYFTSEKELAVDTHSYHLNLAEDTVSNMDDHIFENNELAMSLEGMMIFKEVQFDIRASRKGYTYLREEYTARGANRRAANLNARQVVYHSATDSNEIELAPYFTIDQEGKYRAQEVNLTLYLQEGDTVYLSKEMRSVLFDISNLNNMWDWDMVEHGWVMTEHGLLCTDCADSEAILEKLEQKPDERDGESSDDIAPESSPKDGFAMLWNGPAGSAGWGEQSLNLYQLI